MARPKHPEGVDHVQTVSWRASAAQKVALQLYCAMNSVQMGDVIRDAVKLDTSLIAELDKIIVSMDLNNPKKRAKYKARG